MSAVAASRRKAASSGKARTAPEVRHDRELDELLHDFHLPTVVSHLLRRAHFRAEELFSCAIGHLEVTPRQKAMLISAYQNPGLNQSELSRNIAIDRNSCTEMLARMVKAGLLTRRRAAKDARSNEIYITRSGIETLKRVMPLDHEVEEEIISPLPPEVRALFAKCLRLMIGDDEFSRPTEAP